MLKVLELQRKLGYPAKAGIETRKTVDGLYGAYFYCRGVEQGRERFDDLRALIPPHIPMILKRYCTEFEIRGGRHFPSNETEDATREDIAWEEMLIADLKRSNPYVNKFYAEQQIIDSWIDYPKVVTYHE